MKRTGPTNPDLKNLIQELRKKNENIWKRIAFDLEKPTRKRRVVNLSRINRFTRENEIVVVPGKVLGSGLLSHKLTIAAYTFSGSALEKISKANAKAISLEEFMKDDIKGKRVRIIG